MTMRELRIAHHPIGVDHPPFLIAEMSGNHNQSLERALAIVEAAAKSGAHAIKLQTYTAETMTLDIAEGEFVISDPKSLWHGKSLYQLYEEAHTPWEWHAPIFRRAKELGLIAFSTPFDETAVDFLESLDVPAYKIASFENVDLPLIRKVAATGKPLILSTGMASLDEIGEAVETARAAGCRGLVLLHCVSSYPTPIDQANLRMIPELSRRFDVVAGLSDHTLGTTAAIASIALGAAVIEKHFTLCRADGGPDSAFSLEPEEFATLCRQTQEAWQALGSAQAKRPPAEEASAVFRRSIYFVRDLPAGAVVGPEDIRRIRPGFGLPPKYFDALVGRRLKVAVRCGMATRWEYFDE